MFQTQRLSLTPALSRWERENGPPIFGDEGRFYEFMDWTRDLGSVELCVIFSGETPLS